MSYSTFERALRQFPSCLMGAFDPLSHKTAADLVYLAETEIDFFNEGEDTTICGKELVKVKKFISRFKNSST